MKHIVVTGNIGCGKSYVINRLMELWESFSEPPSMLINMDHEGFQFVYGEGKQYLINNFMTTDKRMISSLVFKNPALLHDLNKHFVPDIKRIFLEYLEWPDPIIIEFPLLFECFTTPKERAFIKERCTAVAILVDDSVRYERAMGRDKKTLEQIQQVDRTQLPQMEKCKLADWVIVNDPAKIDTEQMIHDLVGILNGQQENWHCSGILRPNHQGTRVADQESCESC